LVNQVMTKQLKAIQRLEAKCGGYLLCAVNFMYETENVWGFKAIGGEPSLWHILVEFTNAELAANAVNSARGEVKSYTEKS
jgi:hypothetical protein